MQVQRSSGGLVSRARGVRGDATWVGWPGTVVPPALEKRVRNRLAKDHLDPVFLSAEEEEDFYGKVCNDTLWPLFHYFQDRLRITPEAWKRYVEVNERFADTIVAHASPTRASGCTTSTSCSSRRCCGARAAALDRVLPAHPVPVVRDVPAASRARAAPARRPRRRLRQLPGRRLRAPLPLVVPARCSGSTPSRTGSSSTAGASASASTRSGSTSTASAR